MMAFSAENIAEQIEKPVVEQVAAELKKNYNKFKLLLEITEPAVHIVDAPDDNGFREIAKYAIEQRELKFKQQAGSTLEEVPIKLDDINRRISTLPAKSKKEMGIGYFDINNLIPAQDTLKKVADTVFSSTEEAEKSSFSIGFGAIIKFIFSFFSSFFGSGEKVSFDESKAQSASEHIQKKLAKKFDELSGEDVAVKRFLKHRTSDNISVEDSIIKAVPQGVYNKFADVPDALKIPEQKDLVKDTKVEPAPKISVDETIQAVRKSILYPEGEKPLAEKISTKISEESQKRLSAAQAAHDSASLLEKVKTLPVLETTKELAPSREEAAEMGRKLADIIANGFEKAIKEPDFSRLKNKEEMADFIVQKVEAELASNKDLVILKTVRNDILQKGLSLAEFAGEKSDYAKKILELGKMPPKVGENQYAVVTIDSVRDDIIAGVRESIDEKTFDELKFVSRAVKKEIGGVQEQQAAGQQGSAKTGDEKKNLAFEKAKEACTVKLGSVKECSDGEMLSSNNYHPHIAANGLSLNG